MTEMEMADGDYKITKNFDRYEFSNGAVNGSVYFLKCIDKIMITIEYG